MPFKFRKTPAHTDVPVPSDRPTPQEARALMIQHIQEHRRQVLRNLWAPHTYAAGHITTSGYLLTTHTAGNLHSL